VSGLHWRVQKIENRSSDSRAVVAIVNRISQASNRGLYEMIHGGVLERMVKAAERRPAGSCYRAIWPRYGSAGSPPRARTRPIEHTCSWRSARLGNHIRGMTTSLTPARSRAPTKRNPLARYTAEEPLEAVVVALYARSASRCPVIIPGIIPYFPNSLGQVNKRTRDAENLFSFTIRQISLLCCKASFCTAERAAFLLCGRDLGI
jgi:hypothetical protein